MLPPRHVKPAVSCRSCCVTEQGYTLRKPLSTFVSSHAPIAAPKKSMPTIVKWGFSGIKCSVGRFAIVSADNTHYQHALCTITYQYVSSENNNSDAFILLALWNPPYLVHHPTQDPVCDSFALLEDKISPPGTLILGRSIFLLV